MNQDLTPSEEQALDALLSELHGDAGPPDLSREILARLDRLSDTSVSPTIEPTARRGGTSTSAAATQIAITVSVIAAVAATILVALSIHLRKEPVVDDSVRVAVAEDQKTDQDAVTEPATPETKIASVVPADPPTPEDRPRPRSLPMVVVEQSPQQTPDVTPDSLPGTPSTSEAVMLVSADVDSELQRYWQAIGIEPMGAASDQEVVDRLEVILGVKFSAESVRDAELTQQEIARPAIAQAIALQWLRQITGGGVGRIKEDARKRLVNEVAKGLQSKRSFDQMLAEWIGGASENTSSFYTAVSSGGEHQMVRRLASLTMNVDLRCIQCHDAQIESKGRQEEYWSFAAFLRHGLKRQKDRWSIRDDESSKPVFYDLPDGIRKVAVPAVASNWIAQRSPISTIPQWSEALVGSPELARGIVNSLWQLVHGEPLQGRVIDAITAPHDESLDRLEERLTNDLVQSRFDIGRTLALIITSPASDRGVPEALRPENLLVSSEKDVQAAMASVNAFAAALPPRQHVSIDRRLDVALRRVGAKIEDVKTADSLLAQGTGQASSSSNSPSRKHPKLGHDFPGRGEDLPVQWLSAIQSDDEDVQYSQRVRHLGYLAGMSRVSDELLRAADTIHAADENSALALQRVWWLVRP